MVPTGKSPEIAAERLQAMGFSLAIYPTAGMTAACAALEAAYQHIRARGTTQGSPISSISMSELHDLVGFPEIWDFEHRFAELAEWLCLFQTKTLIAIVKMGQILFIFCARKASFEGVSAPNRIFSRIINLI